MIINVEMTKDQSLKMAQRILTSNFQLSGSGHFNITKEEFAEVLRLAFNSKNTDPIDLKKYYKVLHDSALGDF